MSSTTAALLSIAFAWATASTPRSVAPTMLPLVGCPGAFGVYCPCLIGEFAAGIPVRPLAAGPACTGVTAGSAIWPGPDPGGPTTPEELEKALAAGQAERATLLEGVGACLGASVAMIGFEGSVEALPLVPVRDAATRKRLADRARSAQAVRDVIRADEFNADAEPEADPLEVYRIAERGPTFVRLRSKSASGSVQNGPLVVFEGEKLTTPFALCTNPPEAFRAGGRIYFQVTTGLCDSGAVLVAVYEVRGVRLVKVFETNAFAD